MGSGLTNAGHIQANGVDIRVASNSFPSIDDWDEDGRKDLIVGEQSAVYPNTGNIRLYINTGTNDAPSFGSYTMLSAGGNQIYHYRANPVVSDLDQDGLKDLIVGDNTGMVFFYKNVGTNDAPVFNALYDTLKTQGGTVIDAYYGSRVNFVDWTEDGDPDMLISGYDGYVQLYENNTIGIVGHHGRPVVMDVSVSPNPVVNRVVLKYSLNTSAHVRARVYSADGRLVTTLIDQQQGPGDHRFVWNLLDESNGTVSAGVYLLRLDAGAETNTQRVLIIH